MGIAHPILEHRPRCMVGFGCQVVRWFACVRLGLWKFMGKKSVDQSMFSMDRWMQMHWSIV
jgi:hypothetical protein